MTDREMQLMRVIEGDRSEIALALSNMRKAIASRYWLIEGRGSYTYEDDVQYRREFAEALSEIEAQLDALSKVARDWSNCPTDQAQIGRARRDRGLLEKHTG
ncbi:hypothetical protein [Sulfitobacter pontiacus]|jgi:hypothetical protein|uniref:hypothetical protein n=1 Tax=Sulfitobacter pontiacus TaxID=60137 RepID=UPI00274E33A1|nr:hypothetical protein [Sulfitobacter pontiacus]GLO78526.1 hypothetical protein MACH23_19470 [Sulfitobacter pontiacus]|tara:strand:+ start:144 stop:449 length:306 start_codon:yes stop_codon:yes gene_type:complete